MAKKTGLGRGLSSIFGEVEVAYERGMSGQKPPLSQINISEIETNPFQPRRVFDEKAIEELSLSIQKHGLLQPILVSPKENGFLLVAGERRLRASKLAGLTTIKAVIQEIPKENLREIALIENIQREGLNPLELAKSYKELISQHGATHEELATILHKSRAHITNTMRLLQLGEYAASKILKEEISHGHAKVLVGLNEKDERKIVDSIINQHLNVRQTEKLAKNIKTQDSKKPPKTYSFNLKPVVEKLLLKGIKSKISANKIVINLENQEDIEKLLKAIK